jgi:hypothetical protein
VIFIGDYFTLITTVDLPDAGRREGETDEDYACRRAGDFLSGFYGWDVAARSNQVGVMDDDDAMDTD